MSRAKAIARKYSNIKMDQQNVVALEKDLNQIIDEIKSEIIKEIIFSEDGANLRGVCEKIKGAKY